MDALVPGWLRESRVFAVAQGYQGGYERETLVETSRQTAPGESSGRVRW